MKDRDLDALVDEKVMGATKDSWKPVCLVNNHSTDEETWCYYCQSLVDDQEKVPPTYSTDNATAWEVVKKLNRDEINPMTLELQVDITGRAGASFGTNAFAWYDTVPRSICLAALRAKGVEVPE